MNNMTEQNLVVIGLVPVADRYNGNPATDVVSLEKYGHATFLLTEGAGGTGTVKLILQACDDFTPSSTSDIATGKYKVCSSGDTWGELAALAATGYTTTAGANKMVAVEIDANDLPDGYSCVRLALTEVVDHACDAGVTIILSKPRYQQAVMPTAIA